jgi:hypothetical protein
MPLPVGDRFRLTKHRGIIDVALMISSRPKHDRSIYMEWRLARVQLSRPDCAASRKSAVRVTMPRFRHNTFAADKHVPR